jgi:carboxypeptidase family protein
LRVSRYPHTKLQVQDDEIVIASGARNTRESRAPRICAIAVAVTLVTAAISGGERRSTRREPGGLVGSVLLPDGTPASEGVVTLAVPGSATEGAIDRNGHFAIESVRPGEYELRISVAGFATWRLQVSVPERLAMALPPLRLSPATYLRMRLLSPDGEQIDGGRIQWQTFDVSGVPLVEPGGREASLMREADGTTTIGPLARGVMVLSIDRPPFGHTRLPDVPVTGAVRQIDLGDVTLDRASTLDLEVVDRTGAPVHGHRLVVDDGMPFLPWTSSPVWTDERGRVRFEGLGARPYRVMTYARRECGALRPVIADWFAASPGKVERLNVDGARLEVHLTSNGVPLRGIEVSVSPELSGPARPAWLRRDGLYGPWFDPRLGPSAPTQCSGVSDGDGRAVIQYVAPGSARARVRLPNSSWSRRIAVPPNGGRIAFDIPGGVAAFRVLDAQRGTPVDAAEVTWTSRGSRLEASVPASGEVLLEGVSEGQAALSVQAQGYQRLDRRFAAPPETLQTIYLTRAPDATLQCRVVDDGGVPVGTAVVKLVPEDLLESIRLAGVDAKGFVRFARLGSGRVRLMATSAGYTPSLPVTSPVPPAASPVLLRISRTNRP